MTSRPIFEITDGTTSISFLAQHEGFFHRNWQPTIAEFKDGGLFANNPITEGRELVMGVYTNAVENIQLRARANSANLLSEMISDLRQMIAKANSYWVSNLDTDDPVYIKVRGTGESNTRYAVIKHARLTGDPNPFSQPYLQADGAAVASNLTLELERDHWQDNAPFNDTSMPATAVFDPDYTSGGIGGGSIGNVDSSGNRSTAYDAFFSNKFNDTNIGSAYYQPSGGSVESNNRQNDALPITYLPSTTGIGDYLYIGSELPFNSIIIPDDGGSSSGDLSLEVYAGGSWGTPSSLDVLEHGGGTTLTLDGNATAKGFVWQQSQNMTYTGLDTASGDAGAPNYNSYWVRITVSSAPSSRLTCNERIYTANWPYLEITSSQIPGNELAALLRQNITPYMDRVAFKMMFTVMDDSAINQPFINFSSQPHANISATIVTGTDSSLSSTFASTGDATATPGGEIVLFSPIGTTSTWTDRVTARLLGQSKIGKFRAFARVALQNNSSDPADEHTFRLHVRTFETTTVPEIKRTVFTSKAVKATQNLNWSNLGGLSSIYWTSLLDFGIIDTSFVKGRPLQYDSTSDANYAALDFVIQSKNPDFAAIDVAFIDLVLMPIDMMGVEMSGYIIGNDDVMVIDCTRDPKDRMKAYLLDETTQGMSRPQLVTSGSSTIALEPFRNYRVHFFVMERTLLGGSLGLEPYYADFVARHNSFGLGRFLSLRGAL